MGNERINERMEVIEEGLSRWVGDVAAHQIGRALRGVAYRARGVGQTLAANIAEYLQEETRHLVTRVEVDEYFRGVSQTREAADRLAARIDRLMAKGGE